jgi:hypothetical protein
LRTKALIILFVLLAVSTRGYSATFSVAVNNGTKNSAVSDYPVPVRLVNANKVRQQATVRKAEGRTDSDGLFTGKIETAVGKVLLAETNYRGLDYISKPVTIRENQPHYNLTVEVYEITSDRKGVSIPSRTMMILPLDKRTLEVYETLQVVNQGNRSYIGTFNNDLDMTPVLHIPVPERYTLRGIQTGAGSSKIRTLGRAIVSQKVVMPGNSQITMRYLVASDIGVFDLSLFSEKDTPEIRELNLYFPAASKWRFKPDTLKPFGEEKLGGRNYRTWKGNPGSVLRLKAYSPEYSGGFNIWYKSVILAFVIAGICLFLARKKIHSWHLTREEKKLEKLRDRLIRETDSRELTDYYQPLRLMLDSRLREAKYKSENG